MSGNVGSPDGQIESEGLTAPLNSMKFVMTATEPPKQHMGQQSHEASVDETDTRTSEGTLDIILRLDTSILKM